MSLERHGLGRAGRSRRPDEEERLEQQQLEREAVHGRRPAVEHGHVHAPGHDELGERGPVGLVEIEDDARDGRSRTVRSSGTARSAAAVPGARPTDTAPGQPLARRLHVGPRLLALAQDKLRVAVERRARRGRRHAALGPHQQLLAHLGLQRRELLAERRLGDVQDVGGLGQAADVDDLHEVLQAPEVHPVPRRTLPRTIP